MNKITRDLFPVSAVSRLGNISCVVKSPSEHELVIITRHGDTKVTNEQGGYNIQSNLYSNFVKESKEVVRCVYDIYNLDRDSDTMDLDRELAEEFNNLVGRD